MTRRRNFGRRKWNEISRKGKKLKKIRKKEVEKKIDSQVKTHLTVTSEAALVLKNKHYHGLYLGGKKGFYHPLYKL